jgi:hypothetical protein
LASAALLAPPLLVSCGSTTDDPDADSTKGTKESPVSAAQLDAVADWLAGEVSREGFVRGQYVDHGLSLDFARTLGDVGGHDDVADRVLDAMTDPREVSGYLSFYDEQKNGRYAGATAKLVHTVVSSGRDLDDYRSGLVEDLTGMVVDSGADAGRVSDTGPTDYSNTITQAYAVRAFAVTESEQPLAESLEFLLLQQCEDGWFREQLTPGRGGDNSCEAQKPADLTPSVDATAHALQALLEVDPALEGELAEAVDVAVDEATQWLEDAQTADGGFSVTGTSGAANANSTGLASEALVAAGRDETAAEAATWLLDHMIGEQATGPLAEERGVVAFDDAALAKARKGGVKPADRFTWQRATVEAARGLHAAAGD